MKRLPNLKCILNVISTVWPVSVSSVILFTRLRCSSITSRTAQRIWITLVEIISSRWNSNASWKIHILWRIHWIIEHIPNIQSRSLLTERKVGRLIKSTKVFVNYMSNSLTSTQACNFRRVASNFHKKVSVNSKLLPKDHFRSVFQAVDHMRLVLVMETIVTAAIPSLTIEETFYNHIFKTS